jgi:hypothetical protein
MQAFPFVSTYHMDFDGMIFEIILKLSYAMCRRAAGCLQSSLQRPHRAVIKKTGQTGNAPADSLHSFVVPIAPA